MYIKERYESRSRHFFKDILPEEAFDRPIEEKPELAVDDEEFNRLLDIVLGHCKEVAAMEIEHCEEADKFLNIDTRRSKKKRRRSIFNLFGRGRNK